MGGVDPLGAQAEVLKVASNLGMDILVVVAYECPVLSDGSSTYLGAAPIVQALQKCKPHVIITSRLADVPLFLGPMVYELGWNWNSFPELSQGALAAHLLECGCQLTGGYYAHPGDPFRNISLPELLDVSLPYADIFWDGRVIVAKAEGSGGEISERTCAEQLLYEVEDPSSYVTPDVILDLRKVTLAQLSRDKVLVCGARSHGVPRMLLRLVPSFCGWKGWGEISYGGSFCEERAKLAEKLVVSWMEELYPGTEKQILSYLIGKDSLFASPNPSAACDEVRLRLDGLFDNEDEAVAFTREFTALYTNGPAGGGGVSSGFKREITLEKKMVPREEVFWTTSISGSSTGRERFNDELKDVDLLSSLEYVPAPKPAPAPSGIWMNLYQVAHSRTGDKGNTLNCSLIPHCSDDIGRLQRIITQEWVKNVFAAALRIEEVEVSIYLLEGVSALNIVVKNALDGGVTCSRRIDRHGKTLSDLILSQKVCLW